METSTAANNTTAEAASNDGNQLLRPLWASVLLIIVLGIIILLTVLGNLLVCVTVVTQRRLHTATNLFVFSLAATDLMLGLLVLPFSSLTTIWAKWPLGSIFCNIYISNDVWLCTISILNLFAISLDRHLAVTKPFRYEFLVTKKRVYICIASIWLSSLLLAYVPIHVGWNTENGCVQNVKNPENCIFELGNKTYAMFISIGTYFVPLIIMCAVYARVYSIAKSQVKQINSVVKNGNTSTMKKKKKLFLRFGQSRKRSVKRDSQKGTVSDRKATITLGCVVVAFVVCWVPYFLLFSVKPWLRNKVNMDLDLFCLWLGYVNRCANVYSML